MTHARVNREAKPSKYVAVVVNNVIPGVGGWSWVRYVLREKATR